MSGLAEIQFQMRQALVQGEVEPLASLITGDADGIKRLNVHRRNYETSLTTALVGKFPATCWLVGTAFVAEVARHFVQARPPRRPCIAEFGEEFPAYLAGTPGAASLPYLRDFAELEWRIGHVSIAADEIAATVKHLASVAGDDTLRFQGGVRYLEASWPVDELMKVYLTDSPPDRLVFDPARVWLEIRGSRGEFNVQRLGAAQFAFRNSLCNGHSISEAAEHAVSLNSAFDPATDLAALIAGDFLVAGTAQNQGDTHDEYRPR
jgi:Putative DNA-binding domain